MPGSRQRHAAVAVLGLAAVTVVAPSPAAWASAGAIYTVAGGPGSGMALSVGQDPVALTGAGSQMWVMDRSYLVYGYLLRSIDTTTGQESAPILSVPMACCFHPYDPSVAADGNGDVFVAYNDPDRGGMVIERLASGTTRVVAGGGSDLLMHVDNAAATAERLDTLNGVAVDAAGDVYVSENDWQDGRFTTTVTDSRIHRIDPDGTIHTAAGVGQPGFSGDGGPAILAQLNAPMGLATDRNGAVYIADWGNQRVRKLDPSGAISTVAGGGTSTADGVAATTAAVATQSVSADSDGVVVATDCRIRRIAKGHITTVAGSYGNCGWSGDGGRATSAAIQPQAVAAVAGGLGFVQVTAGVPGYGANVIRRVDAGGTIGHYAGTGRQTYGGDGGPALQAQFSIRASLAVDAAGNIYVTDSDNKRLRKIDATGVITTFAGTGVFANGHDTGDGGAATQATFKDVSDVAVAPDGDVYVSDSRDYRIRRIDASGTITTVAGDGVVGNTGDGGPATMAEIGYPARIAFDRDGNLLIAGGCRIRRVDAAGVITTIAGTGTCNDSGDGGPATAAGFASANDVAADAAGDIYVATYDSTTSPPVYRVRRIDPSGIVTTVAGGGTLTADGVPATESSVQATAVSVDAQGRLLIVEADSGRVRRVDTDGTITTVAGGGSGGDGGPAASALLSTPRDVVSDGAGNLYIACTDARTPYGAGAVREVIAT